MPKMKPNWSVQRFCHSFISWFCITFHFDVNFLFLQSSKCSCRPGEPELHPLFISAGGSQGQMNESRALGGMSAGWRNREALSKNFSSCTAQTWASTQKIVGGEKSLNSEALTLFSHTEAYSDRRLKSFNSQKHARNTENTKMKNKYILGFKKGKKNLNTLV